MSTPMLPNRSYALDALRGWAILTMVLSGVIPTGILPAWMYHAQNPPPLHKTITTLAGITWVDLVFPFFLFALGAAIPLALGRRLEKGEKLSKIAFSVLERGLLLGFFAIFLQHLRPYTLQPSPDTWTWLLSLLGFVLMFSLFSRLPDTWSSRWQMGIKVSSWLIAIIILALVKYPDGSGFSLNRSDIIIIVLANMALFGALAWLCTRENILLRIGLLGFLIAIRLAANSTGWVQWLWQNSPVPWIYRLYYLQYLFIVIPGTIVGDFIRKWLGTPNDPGIEPAWTRGRLWMLATLLTLPVLATLVGLFNRWLVSTSLIITILCIAGWYLMRDAKTETEKFNFRLFQWSVFWLLLGLVFEPYEGGIKKSSATLSYYFVTTGLAIQLLISFTMLIDMLQVRFLQIFIDNGQNPMIAYVGVANAIWPVFALAGIDALLVSITQSPLLGFLRGLFYTLILAYMTRFFTRHKIFWRT